MKTKHEIYYDKEKTKPVKNYKVDEDGYAIIRNGIWYVYGKTKVKAYGYSKVYAYGNSTVHAHNDSRVYAFYDSEVMAYDNSTVRAVDKSRVWAYDNSEVFARCNSWVCRGVEWPMTIFQNSKIIDRRNKDEKRK